MDGKNGLEPGVTEATAAPAGALEQGRIGHGRRRDQGSAQIQREGRAQPFAIGPPDQAEPGPAAPA